VEEIREYPKETPKLMIAILFELVANVLAGFDVLFKKEHKVWRRINSTKTKLTLDNV
jgi:hypothetical protein